MNKIEIYILSYGSNCIDDYDIDAGVFTSKESLKKAYIKLLEQKIKELGESGFSLIETIKIFGFEVVDDILTETIWENRYRIKAEEFGLPDIIDDKLSLDELKSVLIKLNSL